MDIKRTLYSVVQGAVRYINGVRPERAAAEIPEMSLKAKAKFSRVGL